MKIHSIQIGKIVTEGDPNTRDVTKRLWSSAFDKRSVADKVAMGELGIAGDEVADKKHHGGIDKAVLCYSASHYDWWQLEYPDLNIQPGGFGENLTFTDLDESTVCIGDRYTLGTCIVEVSQPRQPCWKIARRWGDKTLTKVVGQTGKTGWYVRVIQPGTCQAGDPVQRTHRPNESWTVGRANDILMGRESDRYATMELMQLPELADDWKADLA